MPLLAAILAAILANAVVEAAPQVFAPGVISGPAHDSAPAFTPDGKTLYFGRSTPAASFILTSRKVRDTWSAPTIAPFSGAWLDMEPAMSPDGSFIVFASNRPVRPGGAPIDGALPGDLGVGRGANLWRVDRVAGGWSEPVRLPDAINASGSTYAPSIARDGTLYFMRPNAATHRFELYRAEVAGTTYATPFSLPFSDGANTDVDPAISADQTFLVFGSGRHAKTDIDLFITFRTATGWTDPTYLGDTINGPSSDAEPRLSPDNSVLYFSSDRLVSVHEPVALGERARVLVDMDTWNNGLYNIWEVGLSPILRELRPIPAA